MQKLARALALPLLMFVLQPAALHAEEDGRLTLNAAQQSSYDRAFVALDAKQDALAYAMLSELADLGHAPSARQALMLKQTDPALFKATPQQLGRWNALVIADTRVRTLAAKAQVQASK